MPRPRPPPAPPALLSFLPYLSLLLPSALLAATLSGSDLAPSFVGWSAAALLLVAPALSLSGAEKWPGWRYFPYVALLFLAGAQAAVSLGEAGFLGGQRGREGGAAEQASWAGLAAVVPAAVDAWCLLDLATRALEPGMGPDWGRTAAFLVGHALAGGRFGMAAAAGLLGLPALIAKADSKGKSGSALLALLCALWALRPLPALGLPVPPLPTPLSAFFTPSDSGAAAVTAALHLLCALAALPRSPPAPAPLSNLAYAAAGALLALHPALSAAQLPAAVSLALPLLAARSSRPS